MTNIENKSMVPAADEGRQFLINDDTPETSGKLHLHPAANPRKTISTGMIIILLVFGGFGTWAAIAPLSSAIIGSGVVKVDLNRKTVQHLEGGIVEEIRVRDGDHVKIGQTLIVIRDERVDASIDVLHGQLDTEMAKAVRLEAQRDNLEEIIFPESLTSRLDEPKIAKLINTENTFFHTKRNALLEEIALLEKQKVEAQREIEGLKLQVNANTEAARLLEEEITSNESLERSQYVQKIHILGLKRGLEDYHARRGDNLAKIAATEQKISNMDLRIVQLKDDYVQRAVEDLTGVYATGVYAKIFDLTQRLRPTQDMKRRQQIVAPITGTVVDMKVFTIGGIIAPREPLMDIVPDNNPLIVEAKIPLDSIDDVQIGLPADIRFSAYKSRSTPLVDGTVTYVSADRLTDRETGISYYLANVHIDPQSLAEAKGIKMLPGMPAEVYIKTGTRTAFDYLTSPITSSMRKAFREP